MGKLRLRERQAWRKTRQKFLGNVERSGLGSSDFWLVWMGKGLGAVGREDVKMENYKIIVLFLPV